MSRPTQPRHFHTSTRSAAAHPVSGQASDYSLANPNGVPDLSHYRASGNGESNRTLQYFVVGSLGVLAASGAKSTVTDLLSNLAASADVLALAKIEVEMGNIPEGEQL